MKNRRGFRVHLALLGWLALQPVHAGAQPRPAAVVSIESLPLLRLTQELRLGSVEDARIGFSRIGGVDVARDGTVFVLEAADRQIRAYSPQGARLRVIGGPGGGPGEFERPVDFGVVGDTVWVRDQATRRITLFSTAGRVLATVPGDGITVSANPSVGMAITVTPEALRPGGTLSSTPMAAIVGPPPDRKDSVRVPQVRFDLRGSVIDTIGWKYLRTDGAPHFIRVGGSVLVVPDALDHSQMEARRGSTTLVLDRSPARTAGAGEFVVRRVGANGAALYERRLTYSPRPVSQRFRDSLVSARLGEIPAARRAELAPPLRAALPAVPFHPPIVTLVAGDDGSALLRRSDSIEKKARWVALRPDGSPRGEIRLDERATPAWIRGDSLWVIELDAFDVPWLVRYRVGAG